MKIAQVVFLSGLHGFADAASLRGLSEPLVEAAPAAEEKSAAFTTAEQTESLSDETRRALQAGSGCYGSAGPPPTARWHPQYAAGWTLGHCRFAVDCDSPGFETQLDCCKGAYSGQSSGHCLSQLPDPPATSPPTTSPTDAGGPDAYYPDYDTPWPEAGCFSAKPVPSGRPTYGSMLACCNGSYGGQLSGKCLSALPSPPTASPTSGAMEAGFWYPDYDTAWSVAGCSNALPLPYANVGDRPSYATRLECCEGAFGGQASGACVGGLPAPPTASPTGIEGLDYYYPDYGAPWSVAACRNDSPPPFGPGDRPTYGTMLECCRGEYGGQVSGACLAALPTPPTASPAGAGGLDVWYPDRGVAWPEGTCINNAPLPNNVGPTYGSMLECCRGAFGGQPSGACLAALPSPPTASPTGAGGLGLYYRDPSSAWNVGTCVDEAPLPYNVGNTYGSKAECCDREFGGQVGRACWCDADPCHSCDCGTQAELDALQCGLACS